ALIGMILCSKWKLTGFFISLGILLALSTYNLSFKPISDQYLHLGIIFSLALGFFIAALASEEGETHVHSIQVHAKENLLQELNTLKLTTFNEIRDKTHKISSLAKDLSESQANLQSSQEVIDMVQEEILLLQNKQESLTCELVSKHN